MFAVLVVHPTSRKGFLGRMLDVIRPPKTTGEMHRLLGAGYRVVETSATIKGELPWDDIVAEAGGPSVPLLLPKGTEIPQGLSLREFVPNVYLQRLLQNMALNVVDKSRLQLYQKVVGLIDQSGEHVHYGEPLLKYATVLKVYTHTPEVYEAFADRMMDLYGATVLLCDNLASFTDCMLVVSPGAFATGEELSLPCPVLAVEPQAFAGRCQVVEQLSVEVPGEIQDHLPPDIDPVVFLGALYELGRVEALGELVPNRAKCKNRLLHIREIVAYTEEKSKKSRT